MTDVTEIDFAAGAPVVGDLEVRWNHGAPGEPPIQVHAYDPHTYVLRQAKATNYEAPFIYLMFGNQRAMLLDTGATTDARVFPLRETVDGLVTAWLADNPRDSYELVVAHTHGHGDHVAADEQFARRPLTRLIRGEAGAVGGGFGLSDRPPRVGGFGRGGRVPGGKAVPR